MKLPTMTRGKHWAGLIMLIAFEAFLAFVFFAYTPVGFIGFVLVVVANIQWVVAAILALRNITKEST